MSGAAARQLTGRPAPAQVQTRGPSRWGLVLVLLGACRGTGPVSSAVEGAPEGGPRPAVDAAPGGIQVGPTDGVEAERATERAAPEKGTPDVSAPVIVDHLIPWTSERLALTQAYLAAHRTAALTGDPEVDTRLDPKVIVVHWTAGPTAASAWATFAPARLSGRTELAAGGALNVGAHYLVDRDGRIERIMEEEHVVRHCIGLNHVAIGIENVGADPHWPLTDAQLAANLALIRWIVARHPIERLIGHLEYEALEGTPLFEERDPNYRTKKPDPGAAFMVRLRAGLADLALPGPP